MSDDGWRPTHVRVLYRYKDMTREEWVSKRSHDVDTR